MKPYYRELVPSDMKEIMNLKLRDVDIREIKAASGFDIDKSLFITISSTESFVIIYKNKIIAIFGVNTHAKNIGVVWMFGTDALEKLPKLLFNKTAKKVVENFSKKYALLFNYIASYNKKTIRWLEWLGFELEDSSYKLHDPDVIFYKFYKGGI